ncbi:MAG: hypothetical protein ACI9YB_001463 [Halioglobus sp.]|jgi:hypothetical protein
MFRLPLASIAAFIITLSSCSRELSYQDKEILIDHQAAISKSSPQYTTIILKKAKDLRIYPDKLGEIRHGNGSILGKITTKQDIPNFFDKALKAELENAGFKVQTRNQTNGEPIPEDTLLIQQQILHVSAHPPKGMREITPIIQGDIIVDLSIQKGPRNPGSVLLRGKERVSTRHSSADLEKEALEAAFAQYVSETVGHLLNTSKQIAQEQGSDKAQVSIKQ